ncbi:MAG: chemotaxis protein CheW [Lawsonibacter sp.]
MDTNPLFSKEEIDLAPGENVTADLETQKYLLFQSNQLLFGVIAESVVEIITNHDITPLPLLPPKIRGIINLRGQIIPILDIRLLLGQEASTGTCTIILNIDGTLLGILVDSVEKMLDIDAKTILPSPPQSNQELVSGMCSLADGQTMLVLDCPQLLR